VSKTYVVSWYEGTVYRNMTGIPSLALAKKILVRKRAMEYLSSGEKVCHDTMLADCNGKPIDPPDRKSQIELAHEGR